MKRYRQRNRWSISYATSPRAKHFRFCLMYWLNMSNKPAAGQTSRNINNNNSNSNKIEVSIWEVVHGVPPVVWEVPTSAAAAVGTAR